MTKRRVVLTAGALLAVACHGDDKHTSVTVVERLLGNWRVVEDGTTLQFEPATQQGSWPTVVGEALGCSQACDWRRESKELISVDRDTTTETLQNQLQEDGGVILRFRDDAGLKQLTLEPLPETGDP